MKIEVYVLVYMKMWYIATKSFPFIWRRIVNFKNNAGKNN